MDQDNKIRVMHVIDSLAPGGAERVLVDLVTGLNKHGLDVYVCVTRNGITLASDLPRNINLLILDRNKTWEWKAITKLIRFCDDNHITILHVHGRSSYKLCSLVKLLSSSHPILVFHDHYGDIHMNRRINPFFKGLIRYFVDYYIGVDEVLVNWAIETVGLNPDQTMLLRNAIDINRFNNINITKELLPTKPERLKAAVVANLKPQKNHQLLIKAYADTKSARSKLDIFLIGTDLHDEYSNSCRKLVEDLGLSENIFFLGNREDVPLLLNEMDIGLLSSRSETGPLTLLEYMASRLPFIVTKTGQITLLINKHGIPYIVDPDDLNGFTNALDELVNLPQSERDQLGLNNQKFLENHFSIDNNVCQVVTLYQDLIHRNMRL